jgi:inner membrane protein
MAILTIGLLIPVTWVYSTVQERATRRDQTVREVSATWGGPQTLGGPVLSVPYVYTVVDGSGRQQQTTAYAHFLPRDLHVDATVETERRRRGIFEWSCIARS